MLVLVTFTRILLLALTWQLWVQGPKNGLLRLPWTRVSIVTVERTRTADIAKRMYYFIDYWCILFVCKFYYASLNIKEMTGLVSKLSEQPSYCLLQTCFFLHCIHVRWLSLCFNFIIICRLFTCLMCMCQKA